MGRRNPGCRDQGRLARGDVDVSSGSRLGHWAMLAQCPVCPKRTRLGACTFMPGRCRPALTGSSNVIITIIGASAVQTRYTRCGPQSHAIGRLLQQ